MGATLVIYKFILTMPYAILRVEYEEKKRSSKYSPNTKYSLTFGRF